MPVSTKDAPSLEKLGKAFPCPFLGLQAENSRDTLPPPALFHTFPPDLPQSEQFHGIWGNRGQRSCDPAHIQG